MADHFAFEAVLDIRLNRSMKEVNDKRYVIIA